MRSKFFRKRQHLLVGKIEDLRRAEGQALTFALCRSVCYPGVDRQGEPVLLHLYVRRRASAPIARAFRPEMLGGPGLHDPPWVPRSETGTFITRDLFRTNVDPSGDPARDGRWRRV